MDRSHKNETNINLFQWNSQSLRPKLCSFADLLARENIHIAIISESWLDSESDMTISGYNVYRTDRWDGYGGVAIIVHKSIQAHIHPIYINNTGIEVVCIKLANCKELEHIVISD